MICKYMDIRKEFRLIDCPEKRLFIYLAGDHDILYWRDGDSLWYKTARERNTSLRKYNSNYFASEWVKKSFAKVRLV